MRFIKIKLPLYCEILVKKTIDGLPLLDRFEIDFFRDIVSIVAMGRSVLFSYLATENDIVNEVMSMYVKNKTTNLRPKVAEFNKILLDIIDFAESGFLEALWESKELSLEEKFVMVCTTISKAAEAAEAHNPTEDPDDPWGTNTDRQDLKVGNPMLTGFEMISSKFFKGFSFILDYLFGTAESSERLGGSGATRNLGKMRGMYNEIMNNKVIISELMHRMISEKWLLIFNIAKNLEMGFSQDRSGKLVDTDLISSNQTIAKMRNMGDLRKAVLMDMVNPDIFDRKVMQKQIRIKKFRRRVGQKQCLYALLDKSSSTAENSRIKFIKAVGLALGKKALEDGSVFYCRWFEGRTDSLFKLQHRSQWKSFLDYILNTRPTGGTDIDFAMKTALQDMESEVEGTDKADLILITDGTEDITPPFAKDFKEWKKRGIKFHFVFLEENFWPENSAGLAETLLFMDSGTKNVADYVPDFRRAV